MKTEKQEIIDLNAKLARSEHELKSLRVSELNRKLAPYGWQFDRILSEFRGVELRESNRGPIVDRVKRKLTEFTEKLIRIDPIFKNLGFDVSLGDYELNVTAKYIERPRRILVELGVKL